jgi:WD repeat and SOF domain-containing protein 1
MKIKTLSRCEETFTRECKGDVVKVFRNLDPALHPFDKAREYTRALQATKLDKLFAKPFIGTFRDHEMSVVRCLGT